VQLPFLYKNVSSLEEAKLRAQVSFLDSAMPLEEFEHIDIIEKIPTQSIIIEIKTSMRVNPL
jgi:hypothetical protein